MRKNILLLFLLTVVNILQAQEEGYFAPLNPEFQKYIQSESKSGIIPNVCSLSFDYAPSLRSAVVLPDAFDMRTTGLLSTPGDQGLVNACWTFATLDAIQATWAKMGFTTSAYSQENLANCHGFDKLKNQGGSSQMAVAYFSRFNGPVFNASDPFVNNPLGTCKTTITKNDKEALVSKAIFLPKDVNTIKQMVYRYGAVSTAMSSWQLSAAQYYNPDSFSVFQKNTYPGNVVDHAAAIVGWNDNKVIYNPLGDNPSAPGAWIVKGTFGTGKFDAGYFYVSYEDYHVGSYAIVYPGRMEKSQVDTVFSHDKLGHTWSHGTSFSDSAIVVVKHYTPQKKLITGIGTHTSVAGTKLEIQVYQTKTGQVLSGLLGEKKGLVCDYPGFHTFDLPVTVEDDFYVKIKYKTPGYYYPVPIERSVPGYSTVDVKPIGNQWVKFRDIDSLQSVGDAIRQFNLCVKVFAQTPPKQAFFSTVKQKYCQNDTVVFNNTSVGAYDSFQWNFGSGANPLTAITTSTSESVKVVYGSGGMKKVVLKAISGVTTDSIVNANALEIFDGVPLLIHTYTPSGIILKNKKVVLVPKGANSYHWYANSYISDVTVPNELIFQIDESNELFKVTGVLGDCSATDSITLYPTDTCALYDEIVDAKSLAINVTEGPFSNKCATWQHNEPYPTLTGSCTAQNGWCPGEAKLYSSLWFKFVAPNTDSVRIITSGIDNKIALYDALATGTYADIISGNSGNYAILAANDDSSDYQVAAYIKPVKLVPGKTYWLQLDGSLGGVEGNSYITVSGVTVGLNETKEKTPQISNPAQNGHIFIMDAEQIIAVELLDLNGKLFLSKEYNNEPTIDLVLGNIPSGYYVIKMQTDQTFFTQKVLVQ